VFALHCRGGHINFGIQALLMKGIEGQAPYEGAKIYRLWHKKEQRWYAVIVWPDKRTTKSWARYAMEVHLGRFLSKKEQVDHIDEDKTNDDITNLQILTRKENNLKHVRLNNKQKKIITLTCSYCLKQFEREVRIVKSRKNKIGDFCKKECLHKFLANPKGP